MSRQVYHYHRYKARESARVMAVGTQSAEEIRAQLDFPFFCEWVTRETAEPKVQPAHMKVWNDLILTEKSSQCLIGIAGQNTSIRAPRGAAKAQPVDEPVLTPDGWVRMGDLKVGDLVVSSDGKPTQIVGVHPQGVKPSYRVTFTDGSFTECSDDHLWTVRNLAGGNPREFKTLPLNHLRTKVFVRSGGSKPGQVVTTYRDAEPDEKPWLDYRGYAKYHIPIVAPVELPAQKLPIDPYLLGVLIGDGSLTNSSVSFSTGDLELLDLLKPCIPFEYEAKPHGQHPNNYLICIKRPEGYRGRPRSPIIESLRNLGLWGKRAETKFIPEQYLLGLVRDRVSLLQGLLDTDGTVTSRNRGGGISFCSTSGELICNVVELVQSLGGIATVHVPQRNWYTVQGEKKQGRVSWKVGIKLPPEITPFRLTRKTANYKPCTKLLPTRGIVDIELVGETEMQCITVAHSSQLYVTRNYIVTHNSTYFAMLIAWLIGVHAKAGMRLPILYISYTVDVASPKSAAIKAVIESREYQRIFPMVRKGRKWGDESWSIDYDHADIRVVGDEDFTVWCAGLKGGIVSKRCLVGSTIVKTELGEMPISELENHVGIEVLAFDRQCYELVWRKILAFEHRSSSDLVEIETDRGYSLRCTSDHLIYVSGQGYQECASLIRGQLIVIATPQGQSFDTIESVTTISGTEKVYDIEVEDTHNFFANGILVHNCALIVLDDLIKSADDIANPDVRAQMDRNWTRAILPVILPGGRAIHLGNLQRADDIQATRFNEKNGWKVITQSAIVEDDKGNERSYWDFWSLAWLQGLREQDPVGFSFQYQNVIVRSSEISIDPKWIKWGEVPSEASDYEALTIGVDLSSSLKEKADYTVFTLCGRIGNRYYVLDGRRGRWTGNLEKFKHLIEMWRDWDCPEIWLRVENVAYQASFSGDFKDYVVNQRGIHSMTCTPVAAKGDKLQRLRGVTGIFENEMIVFNQYRKLKMWETELVNFGSHGHDDCVDSLVYALSGLVTASRLETA